MATPIQSLNLMVAGTVETVNVSQPGMDDGIMWHTARPEMADGGIGHEGNPGGGLGHEGNPGGGLGHEGNPGGGTGHGVWKQVKRWASEDDQADMGGAALSLDMLLGRLDQPGR